MAGRIESNFGLDFIVKSMEFDRTRWSCPWNSDQNYTKLYQGMVWAKRVEWVGDGRQNCALILAWYLLPIEWNLIRLSGHAYGIVTNTVHKTLPGLVGANGGVVGSGVVGKIDSNFSFVLIVDQMAKELGGWQRGWWGPKGWR